MTLSAPRIASRRGLSAVSRGSILSTILPPADPPQGRAGRPVAARPMTVRPRRRPVLPFPVPARRMIRAARDHGPGERPTGTGSRELLVGGDGQELGVLVGERDLLEELHGLVVAGLVVGVAQVGADLRELLVQQLLDPLLGD